MIYYFLILLSINSIALAGGSVAGNPADFAPHRKSLAWFLGEKPIRWCVQMGHDDDLYVSRAETVKLIRQNFENWRQYLKVKAVKNEWYKDVPFVSFNDEFQSVCTGNEDLTFYIATENDQVREFKGNFTQPSGFAQLLEYNEESGWGKGFIWIDRKPKGSQFFPPDVRFVSLLTHELGHVLGIGHVSGTIMREDLVEVLNSWFTVVPLERMTYFASGIDYDKELFFAVGRGLSALAPISVNPSEEQKTFVNEVLGVNIQDPLHMGFKQGDGDEFTKGVIYLGYEGGKTLTHLKLNYPGHATNEAPYMQSKALVGKAFLISWQLGTMIRFSSSDASIFRVIYKGREYVKEVPGYLLQGTLKVGTDKSIPIVFGRNKGGGEYVRLSAIINNKEVPFFKSFLIDQAYW